MTAPLTWGAPVPNTPPITWDGSSASVPGQTYQGTPPGWVDPDTVYGGPPPAWATDPSFLNPPSMRSDLKTLDEWGAAHVIGPRFTVFNGVTIDNYANEYVALKAAVASGQLSNVGTGFNGDLDAEAAGGQAKENDAAIYGALHGGFDPTRNPNATAITVPPTPANTWGLPAPVPPATNDPTAAPPVVAAPLNTGALAPVGNPSPGKTVGLALLGLALLAWVLFRGGK
jgi:hypothetical protein